MQFSSRASPSLKADLALKEESEGAAVDVPEFKLLKEFAAQAGLE